MGQVGYLTSPVHRLHLGMFYHRISPPRPGLPCIASKRHKFYLLPLRKLYKIYGMRISLRVPCSSITNRGLASRAGTAFIVPRTRLPCPYYDTIVVPICGGPVPFPVLDTHLIT